MSTDLADAITRANHCCIECQTPLGGPVWDEGELIPDSRHQPWCPVLSAGPAMLMEYHDIMSALQRAGYGGDYCEPVPAFSEVLA